VKIKPGIYDRHQLTNDDYHADRDYLSSSGVKCIIDSLAHFYAQYLDPLAPKAEEKPAFVIGSAVHAAILEPDIFDADYLREPKLDRRTKAGKLAAEEFANASSGKIVLPDSDYQAVIQMRDQVLRNPLAADIVKGAITEQSFFALTDDGIGEKCRTDVFRPAAIADVKTVQSALPRDFFRDAANYRYFMQGAFYLDVVKAVTGDMPAVFAFIAVEKTPPHPIIVYTMRPNDDATEFGRIQYREALDKYRRARDSNNWHELMPMQLPDWAKNQLIEDGENNVF